MPSKVKPVALRLNDSRRAKVDDSAQRAGISRHAMLLRMVDAYQGEYTLVGEARESDAAYLERVTTPSAAGIPTSPKDILVDAERKAAHLGRRAKWGA